MLISPTVPAYDPTADDEVRQLRALGAMCGLETLLESQPPGSEVPAADVLALVSLVHDAVRDVLLWQPPGAANDND